SLILSFIMDTQTLIQEVKQLKKEKDAVILAHNYQVPEVQDIADYIGDSLGLSRQAATTEAEVIVFCGVHFMAETASIISPDKTVLIPDLDAGCSLADSITAEQLRDWKAKHPDAVVVSYINTTAAVKAECVYCCTSSNAADIVEQIPEEREVLFLLDKFLGSYVEMVTGRELNIWEGACHVHEKIGELNLNDKQREYPDAEVLIHPACEWSTYCIIKSHMYYDCDDGHTQTNSGMLNQGSQYESDQFVVETETGILHRMLKQNSKKSFHAINEDADCEVMNMNTLE